MPTVSLKDRFERFVSSLDGYENIDELLKSKEPHGKRRADYLFRDRSVIVEQKLLVSDPRDKPQKFVERLIEERGIVTFGRVSTNEIFAKLPDGEKLKAEMFRKIASVLDTDISNADKQTRDTREIFTIPDALGIVVLLNQSAKTLVPDVVRYGLAAVLNKKAADGRHRYPHNCGTLVISELHSLDTDHGPVTPLFRFVHPNCTRSEEVDEFSNMLIERWSAFNGKPLLQGTNKQMFRAQ